MRLGEAQELQIACGIQPTKDSSDARQQGSPTAGRQGSSAALIRDFSSSRSDTNQSPKMQNTSTDSSFIYIIEIPVDVNMKDDQHGKFSIVQVGSGKVGAQGLKKRMREHYLAWHYATGMLNIFSRSKATPKDYTVEEIRSMEGIVGVISRTSTDARDNESGGNDEVPNTTETSEGETDSEEEDNIDDNIIESEAFVRELIGVRLRTSLVRDLLTQPFESSWGGRSVLDKGKHFSITELRLC
ncbi:hypothetical protein PHYBOEH_004692 [Phytophthora boehmeriae]|uniref:Uncharacterized protein n=1 Tax=Phytophthora boehmeriae TaxID=109152 RepID=A0A8T1WQE2_9STRA|nr:hypothetical protein PHYBOEH_004692 [Phytophthora boehmeriae]